MVSRSDDAARSTQRVGIAIGLPLILLSLASGSMDILSYRQLGEVFTSAMTGNAALLGLEIGRGNLSATSRNLAALAGFLLGLAAGAALLRRARTSSGWSWAITSTLALEEALLVGFVVLWQYGSGPSSARLLYGLIGLSAMAMGLQSTIAHRIGVPGITTTYFTGTLTSIAMGLLGHRPSQEARARPGVRWPMLAFLVYVVGAALAGALETHPPAALVALPFPVVPLLPAAAVAVVLLVALIHLLVRHDTA
jgi:uncharacterized membrane protein YoaK (UPF0700 family)